MNEVAMDHNSYIVVRLERSLQSKPLNLSPVSYFHDKTTTHLWLELAFYEETISRVHIVFAIFALKFWSTFFDNISFLIFQLLSHLFYMHPNNISRQHSVAFW